jgi:2-dehydropantoate 2-reductase
MEIGILGSGAMGGLFGGEMASEGHDVSLFDVDETKVEAINESGLVIETGEETSYTVYPEATAEPPAAAELPDLDVTFVFVKSPDTREAVRQFDGVVESSDAVVTMQNGLSNIYVLREEMDDSKVYGGYTTNGANTVAPNRVRLLGKGTSVVGGEDLAVSNRVADLLNESGLTAKAVEDPLPHIWDKQFINVGIKPLAALTELRHGGMSASDDATEVMSELITEAIEVARARGVELITDDPVAKTIEIISREEKKNKKSSILEDVENERKTEIEFINGSIVEFGNEEGVSTPYNEMATKLVRAKEEGYLD